MADQTQRGEHLYRLSELDDYKVADGYPDIRGWDVKTADGQTLGKVEELVVDTDVMRVRYVDVKVDDAVRGMPISGMSNSGMSSSGATTGDGTHTLLPVGTMRLDEQHDDVIVDGQTMAGVAALPRHSGTIDRAYEQSLRARLGTDAAAAGAAGAATSMKRDSYDHDAYDDQRLYSSRRGAKAGTAGARQPTNQATERLTLSEEQLAVGKQQVSAGEVNVRKSVETEHVSKQVPVMREEVTVERRPISADAAKTGQTIGADEIRIPIMEEQLVTEKRLVAREEIVIRKHAVADQQTVEGDVRRERLVVDREGDVTVRGDDTDRSAKR